MALYELLYGVLRRLESSSFFAQMTSCAIRYDVIYHPFPINSQYLKMWGIDGSAEEFNLGLHMKLKLQLSSLLPQVCIPQAFDNFAFPGGGVGVNLILVGSLSNNDSNKNVT